MKEISLYISDCEQKHEGNKFIFSDCEQKHEGNKFIY